MARNPETDKEKEHCSQVRRWVPKTRAWVLACERPYSGGLPRNEDLQGCMPTRRPYSGGWRGAELTIPETGSAGGSRNP
jgi:hypothetical protein